MAYSTAYEIYENMDFKKRVLVALTVLDNDTIASPDMWYTQYGLKVAASDTIVNAWEYAQNTNPYHARLGYDPTIITDSAIRVAVQNIINPPKNNTVSVGTDTADIPQG